MTRLASVSPSGTQVRTCLHTLPEIAGSSPAEDDVISLLWWKSMKNYSIDLL